MLSAPKYMQIISKYIPVTPTVYMQLPVLKKRRAKQNTQDPERTVSKDE